MPTPAAGRTHIDALLALLANAGITAYRGEATRGAAAPYVVVWPSPGHVDTSSLVDAADLRVEFQTTCVGITSEQAEWLCDKVNAALHHQKLTVTGRACLPIYTEEPPQPIRRDDTLAEPLFYGISRWVLHTTIEE